MSASSDVVAPPASPLNAFNGQFAPTKTGPLYRAGLAVVAFAMVLLPLVYMGLIALTAWAVFLHLRNDTWLFAGESGRGGFYRLVLYLGPALAGGILVFFMVKPFFARKTKAPAAITLEPAQEPLLFAFVEKICGLVGAPPPCRIDVDCQVNASASLRRGLWSRDLVLTVGLPLASGLDMRQFAGVLAHEFGHFAQGAGMRMTYIIRRINFWFARVVYERDTWDLQLERAARSMDIRIGVVLHAARGCVWLTRRILWALMHAGNAISCFMLRQMEFDADSYEAKLAGSDAFSTTAARLRVLHAASQFAYEDVRQSWASNRLPENLPLLIDHKASCLPAEVQQKLSSTAGAEKTGWLDTHPCDSDRVQAARLLAQPGVFQLTEPATTLFSNFTELSKAVTRHQYEKHLELKFTDQNLMSADEILRESAASAEAENMIKKFYGAVNISLKPLLASSELPSISDRGGALADWQGARKTSDESRAGAEQISTVCAQAQSQLISFIAAQRLAKAGFKLEPKAFGLPDSASTPQKQESAAQLGLEGAWSKVSAGLEQLEPFVQSLRRRVTLALALANSDPGAPAAAPGGSAPELVALLAAVGGEMLRAHDMGSKLRAFLLLAQNRGNHSKPAEVDRVATDLAAELQKHCACLQERLQPFIYPFPHARGRLTVAEYARSEKPSENEWQRAYLDAEAHVERLFALNYRLVGRVLALVDAAEKRLENELTSMPNV